MPNPYSTALRPEAAPQSEPIHGRESEMVANRAGGFVFALSPWKQLERFMILGAEGATYYAGEREMVLDNARALQHCLAEDGLRTVQVIAEIDAGNRAPKRGPLLFALGVALVRGDHKTKEAVVAALPSIVRTASDLFQMLSVIRDLKGGGSWWASRSIRRAIAGWYNGQTAAGLAYQMAKYRERSGFSHRDALRLGHPAPATEEHSALFRWAAKGEETVPEIPAATILEGFLTAQRAEDEQAVTRAIADYRLTWEMVPPERLTSPRVWEALLPNLPYRALLRNLGRMGAIGLLKPLSGAALLVAERLQDGEALRRARVHPLAVLSALSVYGQGHGERGKLEWKPAAEVTSALEAAFEGSFASVEPTGLRYYLALDVSGSMGMGTIAGIPGVTPAMGAAVLAMVTARTEQRHVMRGFSAQLVELPITARSSFADALRATSGLPFNRTDCALPMLDATANGLEVDVFQVLTDNETWAGGVHPAVALKGYRQKSGIAAKLAVVGMTATGYSIADPKDAGMLDLVGFDAAGPEILRAFALGKV